ncbi:unnamed protein product [Prorocentrum cordatum]|uniref:Uncharacterized protein n=1 Tax=Prorocentrum cordatum TaxID=2364126 RepID=A0ABN9RLH4_9DINO|nr:unnamed protein product [Polarella glacialis]
MGSSGSIRKSSDAPQGTALPGGGPSPQRSPRPLSAGDGGACGLEGEASWLADTAGPRREIEVAAEASGELLASVSFAEPTIRPRDLWHPARTPHDMPSKGGGSIWTQSSGLAVLGIVVLLLVVLVTVLLLADVHCWPSSTRQLASGALLASVSFAEPTIRSGELVKEDRADAGAVPRPPPRSAAPPKEAWGLQAAASPKTGDGGPPAQGQTRGCGGLGPGAGRGRWRHELPRRAQIFGGTSSARRGARSPSAQAPDGEEVREPPVFQLRGGVRGVHEGRRRGGARHQRGAPQRGLPGRGRRRGGEHVPAHQSGPDWIIDGPMLEERFGLQCIEVINDFVAQGYGTLTLRADEKIHIYGPKTALSGAPIACIGAGTGLGQCFLTADAEGEYTAFPSEGGHAEFAPRGAGNDETQIELLRYLKVKFSGWNRISFERVVSGKGICNTYEFLAYKNPGRIDKKVHSEYLASRENAGIVAQNARPGTLPPPPTDALVRDRSGSRTI